MRIGIIGTEENLWVMILNFIVQRITDNKIQSVSNSAITERQTELNSRPKKLSSMNSVDWQTSQDKADTERQAYNFNHIFHFIETRWEEVRIKFIKEQIGPILLVIGTKNWTKATTLSINQCMVF